MPKLTQEQADKLKQVLQWIVEGKEIECKASTGIWYTPYDDLLDIINVKDYRIKQQFPKEVWLYYSSSGNYIRTYFVSPNFPIPPDYIMKHYILSQD